MEENKVAQIAKHTDSSRSTDSGVSGNAYEAATETRRAKEWLDDYTEHLRIRDGHHKWEIAKALARYAESECSGLASRVEELERGLREIYECGSISYAEILAKKLLAGARAEEKG